ncbi:uncharacterized protein LOC136029548 isoform X2 [Artemia franciscana]|uniref:uncharacterized protein LOC136029548 isoform X2 n=1 Tax=Artemia franciscana TaxID=6661 RepID=UPI0032DA6570
MDFPCCSSQGTALMSQLQKSKNNIHVGNFDKVYDIISNPSCYPLDMAMLAGIAFAVIKNKKDDLINELNSDKSDVQRLCLLHGSLSYVKLDILSVGSEDDLIMLRKLVEITSELLTTQNYAFHKLKILVLFAKHCKLNYEQQSILLLFEALFVKFNFLQFIVSNFENPEPGVSEAAKEALRSWLSLFGSYSFFKVAKFIYEETVSKLTWNSRSRYILLSLTIPYMDCKEVLIQTKGFLVNGLSTRVYTPLEDNYLSPVGAEMHQAILKSWGKEAWLGCFCDNFVGCLISKNEVVKHNVVNLYLPQVLSLIPDSGDYILKLLDVNNSEHWLAICSILKLDQEKHQISALMEQIAESLIPIAMEYSDDIVRIRAFAYFTYSKKKTDPFKSSDLNQILTFFKNNLNSDCAPFRQQLLSVAKVVIDRVVESSLQALKCKKFEIVLCQLNFIDSWVNMIFENLKCSGNYQRYSTCADLLTVIFGILFTDNKLLSKGSVLTAKPTFLQFANEQGKFSFFSPSNFEILKSGCLVSFGDVREKIANLLAQYFTPSQDEMQHCLEIAESLCGSPKFTLSECGAVFAKLIAIWTRKESQVKYDVYLNNLFSTCKTQFEALKTNFLVGARESSLQGTVCALNRVICESGSINVPKFNWNDIVNFVEEIVSYMLGVLSCKAVGPKDVPPSFGEMADSIEETIRRSLGKMEALTASAPLEDDLGVEISDDHHVVLACAWLNLKESVMLAADIVNKYRDILPHDIVERCGTIILKLMTQCRHKGAIESGAVACATYCRSLSGADDVFLSSIPYRQLEYIINLLESSTTVASITRRSAGLALVVLKIVSSGTKESKEVLVAYAMERLIKIASQEPTSSNSHLDMVQAQALHIIKSLVEDASMSKFIYPCCGRLFGICVDHFSSPFWTIRNASLQLYGGLVLRLIGQKKVNENGRASLTTFGFINRYPEIAQVVSKELIKSCANLRHLNPSLVPLLSLLARLSPGFETNFDASMCSSLRRLLGHVEYKVRELAAQALANFVKYYDVPNAIVSDCAEVWKYLGRDNTNLIHGYMLYMSVLCHRLVELEVIPSNRFERNHVVIVELQRLREYIIKYPYLIQNEYYKLYKILNIPLIEFDVKDMLGKYDEVTDPGFCIYAQTIFSLHFQQLNDSLSVTFPHDFWEEERGFPRDIILTWIQCMKKRLPKMAKSSIAAVQAVDSLTFMIYIFSADSEVFSRCLEVLELRGLEFIVKETDLRGRLAALCIKKAGTNDPDVSSVCIRVIASLAVLMNKMNDTFGEEFCEMFQKLMWTNVHPSKAFILRKSVAQNLIALSNCISRNFLDSKALGIVKFALILLQDESREIRLLATEFVAKFLGLEVKKSPNLAILDLLFMLKGELKLEYMAFMECIMQDLRVVSNISESSQLFSPEAVNPFLEIKLFENIVREVGQSE